MSGKVNESLWRITRMRPATVSRLRSFEKQLRVSYENGVMSVNPNERGEISIDQLVNVLLDRNESHKERGKRARKGRQARKKGIES